MNARIIGIEKEFEISGDIVKNIGMVNRIEDYLGIRANISNEPKIVDAAGVALIALSLIILS
ncbi:hypothetical protein ACFLYQ_01340 [Chloroflexota bacterium]